MRLLFVDDEAEILAGLRRTLFDLDDTWDAEFTSSGPEALAALERRPADVVVSDMRMPGMDGVALLERVQQLYPNSIRMVLSGQTDERSAIRALRIAHQFLAKPFDANAFLGLIKQTAQVMQLMHDDNMRQLIGNLSKLPPIPALYRELSLALQNPETTTNDIMRLVQEDPTMTVRLLRMANSAFFARRVATADLRTAILHLGTNMIRHLVLTVELFDGESVVANHLESDLASLRDRALRMAAVAEALAGDTELRTEAFTMGLLADIGQVVFSMTKRAQWQSCRETALAQHRPLHEVEYEWFGVSHAEVGGFLLGIWGLPFSVVEAVVHHHHPQQITPAVMGPATIAAIATGIIEGSELDSVWVERLNAASTIESLRRQYGP